MPPQTNPPGTVQAAIAFAGPDGVSAKVILHAATIASYTNADLLALANAIQTQCAVTTVNRNILGQMATSWQIESTTVSDLAGGPEAVPVGEATSNVHNAAFGTGSGNAMSPQTAYVLSWRIARRYRGGHPRSYLPGFSQNVADVAGGRAVSAGVRTTVVAWGTDLLAAVQNVTPANGEPGSNWDLGSIQRFAPRTEKGVPNPLNPPVFWPYLQASADLRLDTQRRRVGKPE